MATFDAHSNLAYATVAVAPAPASSGTSLTVANGLGSLFPTAPFNCTVYPSGSSPLASTAEIIRVTNVVGDVFTIVRAQEGTTARAIATGWQIANTATKLVFTDIENAMIQFISAGTTKASASEIVFSNSPTVSFGIAGQTVTASAVGGGTGGGAVSFSGGTSSATLDSIVFSNSNGVSFGLNGSTMTASVAAAAGGSINFSAGTTSNNATNIVFSNSGGISFGLNGSTITAQHNALTSQSNQAASASNGSFTFQTLNFTNASNVTFGTSAGSIIFASVAAQSTQPVAASASNGSFLFSTLAFSNANNVTFGTSAGSIITASVGTAAAGNSVNFSAGTTSNNLGSVVFGDGNGVTFGLNGSTITASVAGAAAGASLRQFEVAQMNNGIVFSRDVDASQGSIVLDPLMLPCNLAFNSLRMVYSASNLWGSSNLNTAGSATWSIDLAIYSRSVTNSAATNFSNSSIIVTHLTQGWTMLASLSQSTTSKSATFSWQTNSTGGTSSLTFASNGAQLQIAGLTGRIIMGIPFAASLTPGDYWIGKRYSISTIGNNAGAIWFTSVGVMTWAADATNLSFLGDTGNSLSGSRNLLQGLGFFSATSSAFPTSINILSDVSAFTVSQQRRWYAFA